MSSGSPNGPPGATPGDDGALHLPSVLANLIDTIVGQRRILVAFDGPDCAGKTTLADLVATRVRAPTLRASVDDFEAPAATRLRLGGLSPEGFYRDLTDLTRFRACLLDPYARGASYLTTAARDLADRERTANHPYARGALLVDGVFLMRPELRRLWTLSVYLHVSEEVTLSRALHRDVERLGSPEIVRERYLRRYLPGQALYRAEARPVDAAHIVVDNTDVDAPSIVRWAPPALTREGPFGSPEHRQARGQ